MRKLLSFSFVLLLFVLVFPPQTNAALRHQILNEVLGVSTSSALPQLDPTAEGPGLILPDSPFFFLDQLKQNIRLALAFTPEEKAKIRVQIAGERLAEVRFMLARNNRTAATVALSGVSDNLRASASELSQAQFQGHDVKKLARELNDGIKAKQKILDSFEKSATGSIKIQAEQAQEDIFESKIEVEDSLPEDELENEVRDDLERRVERKVALASNSAKLLSRDLDELNREASESATKFLQRREEALKEAIKKSDETLRKVQEKLLEDEKKKQEALLKAQQKAAGEAQEALRKAQTAATEFQKAQKVVDEIRAGTTSSPAGSSGGGSSSGGSTSGSGSSGSGSSGSNEKSGGGENESGSGKH